MPRERSFSLPSYGIAILAVALALVLTLLLWRFLSPSIFVLFLAAVMVSAWYGGLGPGLLATALEQSWNPCVIITDKCGCSGLFFP